MVGDTGQLSNPSGSRTMQVNAIRASSGKEAARPGGKSHLLGGGVPSAKGVGTGAHTRIHSPGSPSSLAVEKLRVPPEV